MGQYPPPHEQPYQNPQDGQPSNHPPTIEQALMLSAHTQGMRLFSAHRKQKHIPTLQEIRHEASDAAIADFEKLSRERHAVPDITKLTETYKSTFVTGYKTAGDITSDSYFLTEHATAAKQRARQDLQGKPPLPHERAIVQATQRATEYISGLRSVTNRQMIIDDFVAGYLSTYFAPKEPPPPIPPTPPTTAGQPPASTHHTWTPNPTMNPPNNAHG